MTEENTTETVVADAPEQEVASKVKKYELMAIISSQISDADIAKRVQGLKDLLSGEVVYESLWGMRAFAYLIQKQDKGYYVIWNFRATAEDIRKLEEDLKLYPDLLRHLIMAVPEDYTPMALEEIEAGLEKIREEKAAKRAGRGGKKATAPAKKVEKPAEPAKAEKVEAPAPTEPVAAEKAEAPEEKPAEPTEAEEVAAPAETPASTEETPAETEEKGAETEEGEKKTLDEKLKDIFSDDLDLKL